jgi:hypothetical protein
LARSVVRARHPTPSLTPARSDSKSIYVLLLIYAASTTTTLLPCLAVLLSTPATTAATLAAKTASLTTPQRALLLSSYVPFFVLPLLMIFDMAGRVTGYVRAATPGAEAKKRR